MKLEDYLNKRGIVHADFARTLGVTPQTISRYIRAQRRPTPKLLKEIMKLTEGKVTANDFLY